LGVAAGVAYVPVVFIALWLPKWQYTFAVAAGVSVLTILGFTLSEPAGIPWMVTVNRLLALATIWLTAIGGSWLVLTKRRKAERELRQAASEISRARYAKSRFLETASNDIRHHLQTLVLLNAALRKTAIDGKAPEMLSLQGDALGHLSDLMNSLLDITELETGEFEVNLNEVPIADVLSGVADGFKGQAEAKRLTLNVDSCTESVVTDAGLMKRILSSLISNAIRYTNEGQIDVLCRHDANGIRISVKDTGVGIAQDQLALIFEEFYRVDSDPAGRDGSLGLGLTFVDLGASLLDIKLEVESEPGQGSQFSLLLPTQT